MITDAVAGEQGQVRPATVQVWFFIKTRTGGEIGLQTDNRLQAVLLTNLIKLNRAVEIAVIGDGERRHLVLLGEPNHLVNFREAVQERVIGVIVEVNKRRFSHHSDYSKLPTTKPLTYSR